MNGKSSFKRLAWGIGLILALHILTLCGVAFFPAESSAFTLALSFSFVFLALEAAATGVFLNRLKRFMAFLSSCLQELGRGNVAFKVPESERRGLFPDISGAIDLARRAFISQTQERSLPRAKNLDLLEDGQEKMRQIQAEKDILFSSFRKETDEFKMRLIALESALQKASEHRFPEMKKSFASELAGTGNSLPQMEKALDMTLAETEKTQQTLAQLSEASGKIDAIIQMISDISEKTNLLALNATIEAARAGAAGKGFAVVAGEVKDLASQTKKATGEISAKVRGIQTLTSSAGENVTHLKGRISSLRVVLESARTEDENHRENIRKLEADFREIVETLPEIDRSAGHFMTLNARMLSDMTDLNAAFETIERLFLKKNRL